MRLKEGRPPAVKLLIQVTGWLGPAAAGGSGKNCGPCTKIFLLKLWLVCPKREKGLIELRGRVEAADNASLARRELIWFSVAEVPNPVLFSLVRRQGTTKTSRKYLSSAGWKTAGKAAGANRTQPRGCLHHKCSEVGLRITAIPKLRRSRFAVFFLRSRFRS